MYTVGGEGRRSQFERPDREQGRCGGVKGHLLPARLAAKHMVCGVCVPGGSGPARPHAPLVPCHPSRPILWHSLAPALALPQAPEGPWAWDLEPLKRLTQAGGHASGKKHKLKIVHRRCSRKLIYNSRAALSRPSYRADPRTADPRFRFLSMYMYLCHPIPSI